jgi:flagellar hook-length control protein FliK
VGLQIRASDDRAKRILEESMSHLKESLAQQNLSLAQVDVSVASAGSSSGDFRNDSGNSNQSNFAQQSFGDGMMRQNANQSYQQGSSDSWSGSDNNLSGRSSAPLRASPVAAGQLAAARNYSSGRLDVRA